VQQPKNGYNTWFNSVNKYIVGMNDRFSRPVHPPDSVHLGESGNQLYVGCNSGEEILGRYRVAIRNEIEYVEQISASVQPPVNLHAF
jgi:hypothetical protein